MADIAELGLRVDSSEVVKATGDLNKLSSASQTAEREAENLTNAENRLSGATSGAGQQAAKAAIEEDNLAAARDRSSSAARRASSAANDNSRNFKATSSNVSNLAAQFQDIGVTAAAMQSPLQIALQQGTQLSAVLGPLGAAGAVRSLGAAFLSVFSPVSFLIIGLVALVAAGIEMVNWPKLAAASLRKFADVLTLIAPYAAAATVGLGLLFAPTIVTAIGAVIAVVYNLTIALAGLTVAFIAANPITLIGAGLIAAGAALAAFSGDIKQTFGVDVFKTVKDVTNGIIGAFVFSAKAITATFLGLGRVIGEAMFEVAKFALQGVELLVNGVIKAINFATNAANKIPGVNIGAIGNANFASSLPNPYEGAAKQKVDYAGLRQDALNTDFVGAIASGANAAAKAVRNLANEIGNVKDKKKKGKSDAEKFSDIVTGADNTIAKLKAEQEALGQTAEAAARLKYETDLLNKANSANLNLTASQKAQLIGLADQMATIEVATKKAKEAFDFAKDSTRGFIDDLRQGLLQGKNFFEAFGSAANNVLDKIIGKLEDNLVDALFTSTSGAKGGGTGGILGAIGSLFGFASGGYTGNKGASSVAGVVHGGEYVFSKKATDRIGVGALDNMHQRAKGYSSGGYVPPVAPVNNSGGNVISFAPVIDMRGATKDSIPEMNKMLEDKFRAFKRELPSVLNNLKNRGGVPR